jgi:hypothetical protein
MHMQLTKGAIGNLINRYKAVLKKCHLLNVFGSLAVAGMLVMGGAGVAGAAITTGQGFKDAVTNAKPGDTITLGQDIKEGVGAVFTGKTVTVDFGRHTYTGYSDSVGSKGTETQLFQLLKDSPAVTLKNGILNIATSPAESGEFKMVLQNYCDLTLDNMVVDGTKLLGDGTYTMSNNHGDITINNSTIIAKEGGVALDAYYSKDYADGVSVTVNNSTITGKIEVTVDGKEELQDGAKHQLTLTGGTLTGGLSAEQGAQLYNEGTTVISDVAMAGNTATDKGGAIFNSDDKMGAKGELTLNKVDLKDNKANFGGAIWNEGTLTVTGGSFEGNTADEAAGAIYNADGAKLTVDGVSFKENTAKLGGAINNAKTASNKEAATLTVKNSQFIGNTSLNSQGGAIRNQGTITEISGSTFKGNKASNGGAINNGEWGKIKLITNSVFDGNEATLENAAAARDGGAILNRGTIESIADSTFTNNKTSGAGGAILNKGGASLTFNGTNTFTNNTAAGKANDIHNSGTITVASGTTTLGSGYSQDAGSLTVEGGAALESLGTMEISGGSVAFKDNSLFAVNGNALTGDNAAITVNGGTLTVEKNARLRIDNARSGQNFNIVNGTDTTTNKWTQIEAGTDLLTPTMDENGNVTFKRDKDASDVFTGMDSNTAAMLNTLIDKGLNNVDSDQMGVRFLSRTVEKTYLGADKDAAAATIESAARIAFAGAVPQMTKMASDAGSNAVVNRLGFANPADGAQAMDAEGKIVDRNTTGFALWIAPLWQSQHGWGMEAGNLDYGFNGNLGGVSLGADYTFENAIRAGITFNIGGGYAESSGGDLNSTENNMSFWGLGAYAGWNYENFGLMADVSYTSTWNDLKQEMDGRMGMGDLEADVQASAISAGLRAEYKLETSVLDVIPHIGVRYMSLNTWGYDVDADGGTVLEGDGFHQDIWTFPVGVTFTKDFTLDSGWSFKPSIDFSVIPAAGDIKAKQDVAFTGLPGSYEVETQMMDYLTWQGGVGLELGNDTMSFGVNYTLQAGQHTTGHGVFGSFRYEF